MSRHCTHAAALWGVMDLALVFLFLSLFVRLCLSCCSCIRACIRACIRITAASGGPPFCILSRRGDRGGNPVFVQVTLLASGCVRLLFFAAAMLQPPPQCVALKAAVAAAAAAAVMPFLSSRRRDGGCASTSAVGSAVGPSPASVSVLHMR